MLLIRNRMPRKSASFFSALVLALVLTACGSNADNKNEASSSPAGQSTVSPTATASSDAKARTVKDAYGAVEVPEQPQRIVVLSSGGLDNLLALGVKPVGAPYSISVNANFFKYLASQTEGIENTGTADQPNLETISKLEPDLIVGSKSDHEAVYEDLKRIAPVYMTSASPGEWKKLLQEQADAVGKQAEAAKLLSEFEARIATFQADMGEALKSRTVSLIRPRADHVRIYLPNSFSGAVVSEAGLPRPAAHQNSKENNTSVTEETMADMDADVILSFGRENEAEYFETKIKKNPLWNTLKAVQNNEVHMLDWEVWLSGQGIQAANLMLDDLKRLFVK